jgi:hypothetical protein
MQQTASANGAAAVPANGQAMHARVTPVIAPERAAELLAALEAPFDPADIKWRVTNTVNLCSAEVERIQKAKDSIGAKGKPITPSRVVAELMFGFWPALLARHYAQHLWIPWLHRAFPQKSLPHKVAHRRLDDVRFLRNRVAHHECIVNRDLEDDYLKLLEVAGWICPETRQWIRETTRFEQRFKECFGRTVIVI